MTHWEIGLASYVVIWWLVVFMVLPFGIHPAEADDPGHGVGAPARPRLLLKAAVTTAIATVIWLGLYWALAHHLIDLGRPTRS